MARVGANDVNAAFSADDLTVFANSFDAGADFHRNSLRLFFSLLKAHQYTSVAGIPQGPILKVLKEFLCWLATGIFRRPEPLFGRP